MTASMTGPNVSSDANSNEYLKSGLLRVNSLLNKVEFTEPRILHLLLDDSTTED